MKKRALFPAVLLPLMAAGTLLRLWQRHTAFEPDTGLLTPGLPATACVVILALAAALALFLLARWAVRGAELKSYLAAFALPRRWLAWVYAAAGALLLAGGLLGLWRYRLGLDEQMSRLILSVCLLPTGVGVGAVGWLGGQRAEGKGRFAWLLLGPGYCGCLWLVSAYQGHTGNPNVMEYLFYFLGAVCAVVCCYMMASFSFEKPQALWCLWLGSLGLVFLAMSAADFVETGARMELLVTAGYALYLAAQLICLLTHCDTPADLEPWIPEETEDEEIEVTDHE